MSTWDDMRALVDAVDARTLSAEAAASNARVQIAHLTDQLAAATAAHSTCETLVTELRATIVSLQARIAELEKPPVQPSPGLPFFADPEALAKSDKKWLDHYFPVFGLTHENGVQASDQYAQWNSRAGENGKFAESGGRLRDRPLSDAPYSGTWRRVAAAQEIRDAKKYLRDGFFVNLMSTAHSAIYSALRDEATANFPGFLVVPMVDANGSLANVADVNALPTTTLVDTVASFLTTQNTWVLPDGSVAVASYKANGRTGAWWADLAAKLKTKTGKTVSFVHVYNNSPSVADVKARPAYASGAWSIGSDPSVIRANTSAATYKSAGRLLVGVQPQNIRPGVAYGPWFDEARNTEALRAGLAKLISEDAQVAQGVTWNDLTEGGHYVPSAMRGTAALELSAMGIYEWKTGKKPEILVDYMVVSYRNQILNPAITPTQTVLMKQNPRGSMSTVRNEVEVLTYLPKPRLVSVSVGGSQTNYQAPAGESAKLLPIQVGDVVAGIEGGEVLTSPIKIRSVVGAQDFQYAMVSTLGPTARQKIPNP